MRCAAALACLMLASHAMGAPRLVGRVGMVARGELPADSIGDGSRDGRALVTVRVRGGADSLRRGGEHLPFALSPPVEFTVAIGANRIT